MTSGNTDNEYIFSFIINDLSMQMEGIVVSRVESSQKTEEKQEPKSRKRRAKDGDEIDTSETGHVTQLMKSKEGQKT